jgi:RimJ/RimL family protein N-acetyltransferase
MGQAVKRKTQRTHRPYPAIFLSGERVDLCVLDPEEDLSAYEFWINDRETTQYLASGKYPLTQRGIRAYIKQFKVANTKELLLGIFTKENHKHIGNIALRLIDDRNRNADIGLMIGDKDSRGRGFGAEALRLIIEHAFFCLNLHRVMAGVVGSNIPSVKLFERLGFQKEATLREHFYLNGKYENFFLYGLLRSDYTGRRAAERNNSRYENKSESKIV